MVVVVLVVVVLLVAVLRANCRSGSLSSGSSSISWSSLLVVIVLEVALGVIVGSSGRVVVNGDGTWLGAALHRAIPSLWPAESDCEPSHGSCHPCRGIPTDSPLPPARAC
jgi:hypothetical protein